jgi:dTMP kinase
VVGDFEPELVLILDIPESLALERAWDRGGNEDRFEKKGASYHAKVRDAFLQIAASDSQKYRVVDANQSMDRVSENIVDIINDRFSLNLKINGEAC